MAKTIKELEQELAEALAAKEAAEQKAEQAETEKEKALEEKKAAQQETEDAKLKTEELLKATKEAEKEMDKQAKAFLKDDEKKAKQVKVIFPVERGKNADKDIVLTVNGKSYQIQRGKEVTIPEYLYDVYLCSEAAKNEAAEFIEEILSDPEQL